MKNKEETKSAKETYSKKEMESGKAMAILSYIIPLIPYFAEKENKYVRFHAIQGMNLLLVAVAYSIIYSIFSNVIQVWHSCWYLEKCYKATPWWISWPFGLIGIGITALCVIGIVNVCQNKAKELPIIEKIKIIKK